RGVPAAGQRGGGPALEGSGQQGARHEELACGRTGRAARPMNVWVDACWFALGIGVVLYALTGVPDLGAGVWHLLASGPRKAEQRSALRDALRDILYATQ